MSDGFESIAVECLFPGIDLVEADAVAGCLAGAKMMQRTMAMAGRKQIAVSTRCRARGRPRTKDNFLSRAFCIGIDQRWLVENCTIPLAAVNGSEYQPRYLEVPN
jgi:hypothetical protein